jgi:pimeloyl-ACP methyl ester carboxylesterase
VKRDVIKLAGIDLEVFEGGAGQPLLFLHGGNGFDPQHPYVGALSAKHRLVAPSHPGFGKSSLPDWIDCVDDIAHLYLELMDRLGVAKADVVGCSFGGWIAAEIATKVPERIRKLVMVGAVGVKTGPIDKLDIPDLFSMTQDEQMRRLWHDPAKMKIDPAKMTDEQLTIMARNRETLALLTWEPWMHNPKLTYRLHRVNVPVLFLRGESDGLVSQAYVDGYAKLLPQRSTATIPKAGHLPQIEQPAEFTSTVLKFLDA